MASKADLVYTSRFDNSKRPFKTDMDSSLDTDIYTYLNTEVKDNLVQLANDCFPSGYAFGDDGIALFISSNLYDKLTAVDTYTGGDVTIAATGAWTDVDAANALVRVTPDHLDGDFHAKFQFNVNSVTSNATNETEVRFRLTDGSEVSDAIANVKLITGVTATDNTVPVTLAHEFDSLTAGVSASIKLQYFIVTSTASTIKVDANTNSPIAMQVEKI